MKWDRFLSCIVLTMAACSGSSSPVLTTMDQVDVDSIANLVDVKPEAVAQDDLVQSEILELEDSDGSESDILCAAGEGCFLDSCEENSDCQSGWCVEHMGNQVCSVTCIEECPGGWLCKEVASGPDLVYVCVSPYTHLCRPCHTGADCKAPSGVEDVCVDFGEQGRFCGADCSDGQPCPDGYSCQETVTVEGGSVTQCVPEEGVCECSDKAVKLGLTTPCYTENEWGNCPGLRTCSTDGLSSCDADTPAVEDCNGLDDDCNDEVDDVICDDENQCTQDACVGTEGCQFTSLSGSTCDDGNACTEGDYCDDLVCTGTDVLCDDDNLCTDDSCEPENGCVYDDNIVPCDDEDPCTFNDLCKEGECHGVAVPCECEADEDCADLEDGNVCNGSLFCDPDKFPQSCEVVPETIVICPEPDGLGAECLVPFCEPATGECSFVPDNEGGACNDGNACSVGENCAEGVCQGGVAVNCNDDDPCTTDSCEPDTGCVFNFNTAPCDDKDLCTLGDLCHEGQCLSGLEQLACNDGNVCTDDVCLPGVGCEHAFNQAECDDNNSCTIGDHCSEGDCTGTGSLECEDSNPCTKNLCLPEGGCAFVNIEAACSDSNPCTVNDFCQDGQCAPGPELNCDDLNPCTDDYCNQDGLCVHDSNAAACDDGNPCTVGDHCQGGNCVPLDGLFCDDGNICTTDWCTPADGCVYQNNSLPCNDNDACTAGDICDNGVCSGPGIVDCDDNQPCTDDSCDSATGCKHTPNILQCDDGNACTSGDICNVGVCTGPEAVDCNDGILCTDDTCDPVAGCEHADNTVPCDDGNACTSGDICDGGLCSGPGSVNCDDNQPCTDDSCDPETGCQHTANIIQCDDGNACTSGDICNNGVCTGPEAVDCNDGNLCTDDSCQPGTGCIHTPNANLCDDNNACTAGDVCSNSICAGPLEVTCFDGDICTDDSCLPETGCVFALNQAPCEDNNACTTLDTCDAGACIGGPPPDCDDLNLCTTDSCVWDTGCQNSPVVQGGYVGLCEVCDGESGTEAPVDDGDCGEINCNGLNYYFTKGEASTTGTNYCVLRDYSDLISERCQAKGECKQENGPGCTAYVDTDVVSCGACKYAAGACQECLPYDNDTACGSGYWCQAGSCVAAALHSCKAWHDAGFNTSGSYSISPNGVAPFTVYCDMTTQGGGWTKVNSVSAANINKIMGNSARQLVKCSDGSTKYLLSPTYSNKSWSWSTKQAVGGTWVVNGSNKSCGTAGEFNAASYGWGFGCSNGGGYHNKFYPGMCDNCGFPCNCGIPKGHTMASFSVCGSHNFASYSIFVREN